MTQRQHQNWQSPKFAPNILLPHLFLYGAVPLLSVCREFVSGPCYSLSVFHWEKDAEEGLMRIDFVAVVNSWGGGKRKWLWSSLPKHPSVHLEGMLDIRFFCFCCLPPRGSPVPRMPVDLQPQHLCPLPDAGNLRKVVRPQHHTGLAPAEVLHPRTSVYMGALSERGTRGCVGACDSCSCGSLVRTLLSH